VKFNTTDARVKTADLLCELLNIRDSRYLFLTNFSSEEPVAYLGGHSAMAPSL